MLCRTNRRRLLASAAGLPALTAVPARAQSQAPPAFRFRYSLNTSTVMGQKVPLAAEVDLAADAGYDAIEPWTRELDAHVAAGGTLEDLRKRIQDRGLAVESSIGFFEWIVDDDARRTKALEEAKRCMDMVRRIGGRRLAAPPVGATDRSDLPLAKIAERYRALLELGREMDVVPQVELWGFSKTLGRLGETSFVAVEAGHAQACVLADVYHLHKGGSGFGGIKLLSAEALQVFHMNDYPADPPPATITDAHRVYPGDGVAPLKQVLADLKQIGFRGVLSLELFNRDYWREDPARVARTGLQKMRALGEQV